MGCICGGDTQKRAVACVCHAEYGQMEQVMKKTFSQCTKRCLFTSLLWSYTLCVTAILFGNAASLVGARDNINMCVCVCFCMCVCVALPSDYYWRLNVRGALLSASDGDYHYHALG